MPPVTAPPKSKEKPPQQRLVRPPGRPPAPPVAAADPPPEPTPPRPPSMEDHPGYVAARAKAASLDAEYESLRVEVAGLQDRLGGLPIHNQEMLEAMALAGNCDPNAPADLVVLQTRYKEASRRLGVVSKAVELYRPVLERERCAAWRLVMRNVEPMFKAAMARHAAAVVAAAASREEVTAVMDGILRESPMGGGGLGDQSFLAVGSLKDHDGPVSRWLSELVGIGLLDGDEPFLAGAALIARKPDGGSIDRPSTLNPRVAPQAEPAGPSLLGPAGAALQRGAAAVAGLVTGKPAAPPPPAGPTRQIKLLRGMATAADEWPAGAVVPWAADDAPRLVARGVAEWADGVPAPAK